MKLLRSLWMAALLALVACGGGGGLTALGTGGIGSGGTGAVAVVASGPIEGFGSIIVNGIRFETDGSELVLRDAAQLKLGMMVQVTGTAGADLVQGQAARVVSSAQLRGVSSAADSVAGRFSVLGTQVLVDERTVFGTQLDWAALATGIPVQVWGQSGAEGELNATRIERLDTVTMPLISGTVRALDLQARTFRVGTLTIDYTNAVLLGEPLAEGQSVQVRSAVAPDGGRLLADVVEPALATVAPGQPDRVSVSGRVADRDAGGRVRVDGYWVEPSSAQVSGGPAPVLERGNRVDVTGRARGEVLTAERIKRRGADEDGPFSLSGPVGAFRSPTSFSVRGQEVDASEAELAYAPGVSGALGPSSKVLVTGSRVRGDVLQATRVLVTD